MAPEPQVPFSPTSQKRFEAYQKAQEEIRKLQEQNKALHQKLLQYKTNYFKRLNKVIPKGQVSINQQIKEIITQFNEEDRRFYDAVQRYDLADTELKQAQERFRMLQVQTQDLEQKLSGQREELGKRLSEMAHLDKEIKSRQEVKLKIEAQINHQEKTEIVPRATRLKEIMDEITCVQPGIQQRQKGLATLTQGISTEEVQLKERTERIEILEQRITEQKVVYQNLPAEIARLDTDFKTLTEAKEKTQEKIKHLTEVEILPRETRLKEITDEIMRVQLGIQQRQEGLTILAQEMLVEKVQLKERAEQIKTLEQRRIEQKVVYQNLLAEIARLDTDFKTQTEAKEKTQEKVKHLTEVELPARETQLKKIKDEITVVQSRFPPRQTDLAKAEQELPPLNERFKELSGYLQQLEAQLAEQKKTYSKLVDNKSLLDNQIQTKTAEKKELENKIKYLSEIGLSQQETQLKKDRDGIMQAQTELAQRQPLLENVMREIPAQNEKLKSLQTKETILKREYLKSEQELKGLRESLTRLESEINQGRLQVQQQERLITQLESSIAQYPKLLERSKTSGKLLEFEIGEHQHDLAAMKETHQTQGKTIRDLKRQQKSLEPITPLVQAWRNFLWFCIILLVLGLLGFTLWQAILKGMF